METNLLDNDTDKYTLNLSSYVPNWKTPWYQFDTESCALSVILPCHIHSKILSKTRYDYKYYFSGITLLYSIYYFIIAGWIYIPSLTCIGNQSTTCLYHSEQECNNLFMIVNTDKSYQCKWINFIDSCVPETSYRCIRKDIVNGNIALIATVFGISTLIYIYMKTQFREIYQSNNNISQKKWKDCFIAIFCPICSDAQIYREETIQLNSFITV